MERYFRFSLLLMDPEYFGVSRRKKKCYYRLWVWVSTGPSMNTINQLAIPFSLFYARQLYRILRSVIWGEGGNQLEEFQPRSPNIFLPLCRRRNMKYRFSTLRNSLSLFELTPFRITFEINVEMNSIVDIKVSKRDTILRNGENICNNFEKKISLRKRCVNFTF